MYISSAQVSIPYAFIDSHLIDFKLIELWLINKIIKKMKNGTDCWTESATYVHNMIITSVFSFEICHEIFVFLFFPPLPYKPIKE